MANHVPAPGQLLPQCSPQAREDADSHAVLDFSASPVLTTTPAGYMVVSHFTWKQAEAPRGEETSLGSLEVEGPPSGPLAPSPQSAPLGSHVGTAARLMRVSAAGPTVPSSPTRMAGPASVLLLKSNPISITPLEVH